MDFIARADNHTKKGKRARRHSNLWTNMTCNLLSCEKHNWQQHCDFFFQDIGKLIRSELSYLPPVPPFCCTPILCRPGGLTHLHLSRGSCGITQVRQKDCKRSVTGAMDPSRHKNNVWSNGQLLSQRQCGTRRSCSEKKRPQKWWQGSPSQRSGWDPEAQVLLPSCRSSLSLQHPGDPPPR